MMTTAIAAMVMDEYTAISIVLVGVATFMLYNRLKAAQIKVPLSAMYFLLLSLPPLSLHWPR